MSDPMTNSSRPIKTANLLDPRLEALEPAQKELVWAIPKAPEGMNAVQQQANSYSTAGITWNFNTQSENVLIDRRCYSFPATCRRDPVAQSDNQRFFG